MGSEAFLSKGGGDKPIGSKGGTSIGDLFNCLLIITDLNEGPSLSFDRCNPLLLGAEGNDNE
jgi:hypothetical protein